MNISHFIQSKIRVSAQFTAAIVLASALSACGLSKTTRDENLTYKVGAIVFLSGPQAAAGSDVKNALDLAVDDINKNGGVGGKPMKLLYEDSKDMPKDGIMAFNKLVMDNVPVILATGDVVSLNLAPLARQDHIPLVCTVAAGPEITKGNDWVFRVFIQAERQAATCADYAAKTLKLKSAAILCIQNEYGIATSRMFKDTFEKCGGKIASSETYSILDKDMRNQLVKLIQAHPQSIFIAGFGPAYSAAIRQLKELGYKGVLMTDATISVPYYFEQTTPANEGIYFADSAFDQNSDAPYIVHFTEEYLRRYHAPPSFFSAFAYDSLKLIQLAANQAIANPGTTLQKALTDVKEQGLTGNIRFTINRELDFPLVMKKIKSGKSQIISLGR